MSIKSNIAELHAFLADQPTYSTHEHLRCESDAVKSVECEQEDILWLYTLHYTKSDLISSGATKADVAFIGNPQHSFADRHHRLSKFGARSQNTTQMKTLHAALRALYGGDIFDLNQATEMEKRRKEIHRLGLYREILQKKGKLLLMCRDWGDEFREQQYFRTAVRMEEWIGISSLCDLQKLESASDRSILNLADLTSVVREQAEKLIAKGAIAFKNAMIYQRNPAWVRRSTFDAESAFSILTKYLHADWVSNGSAWRPELQSLQDYLYGEICALAAERDVPMQIHTGLPEGNCLPLDWGDPTHFLELIRCFPKLEIHLMHLGHPYEPYAIAMAKMYPNVQLDCSWIHQLNAHAARFYVNWMLDEVPIWKILGFGGDYIHMEGVYGHLMQTRVNLSTALAERIETAGSTISEAKGLLTAMLYDNPRRLLFERKAADA